MTSYNRHDRAKGYTAAIFHADRVAQSAEMNELQSMQAERVRGIADVLFANGDITEGARCTVDAQTGACTLEAGRVYLNGAVHDLAAAALQVPTVGVVTVGVLYRTRTVTALEDATLYNPAINTSGYGEAGADRLQVLVAWALQTEDSGEGGGEFYPVWTIEDGVVRAREPAPTLTAVTQAIARYDRDSAGGTYAVRGLDVMALDIDAEGRQVYAIGAGSARVNGVAVESPVDRRLVLVAVPDTQAISSEPHSSSTAERQAVAFDRWPVLEPAQVRIQKRKTATITHGAFLGVADPLPDSSVVILVSVTQGGTTYVQGADYQLTAGQIDWSLSGAEPTPGSTYQATYEFISTEGVQNQTPRGFEVEGALPGTLILVDYTFALRRIDRIVMDAAGALTVVRGVPAEWSPAAPAIPDTTLALASVYQDWTGPGRVTADGVRMVSMQTLVGYSQRMDGIELDLAELRLSTDVNARYGGLRKGYFADPMRDNSMRDQGIEQTAMIEAGALQLYESDAGHLLGDGRTSHALDYTLSIGLRQAGYSRAMPINPHAVAGQLPASVTLAPAIDRWEHTQRLSYPRGISVFRSANDASAAAAVQRAWDAADKSLLDTSGVTLRQIEVGFEIAGFKPLEPLQTLTFDGQPIDAAPLAGGALVANAAGVLAGRFTVPQGIPVGTKAVSFLGEHGSTGRAQYTGSATVRVRLSVVATAYYYGSGISVGFEDVTYVV